LTPTPPGQPLHPGGPPGQPARPNQPTPPVPGSNTPTTGKPWYECDDCGTPTDCKGEGPCQTVNEPKITKSDGPDCETTKCVPVENKPEGELPSIDGGHTLFYRKCVKFEGTVNVPHYVLNKKDTLVFAKRSYSSQCCTFAVCVVECCCTTTKRECDLRPRKVTLEACIRQTGEIDVYVLDVPGMPKRWVLLLGISVNELQQRHREFPGF
jgi:hypothetical protein